MPRKKNNLGSKRNFFEKSNAVLTLSFPIVAGEVQPSEAILDDIIARLSLLGNDVEACVRKSLTLSYADFRLYWVGSLDWTIPVGNTNIPSRFTSLCRSLASRLGFEKKTGAIPDDLSTVINSKDSHVIMTYCYTYIINMLDTAWKLYNSLHIVASANYLKEMDIHKSISFSDMSKTEEIAIDLLCSSSKFANIGLFLTSYDAGYCIINPDEVDPDFYTRSSTSSVRSLNPDKKKLSLAIRDKQTHCAHMVSLYKSQSSANSLDLILLNGISNRLFIPVATAQQLGFSSPRRVVLATSYGDAISHMDCYSIRIDSISVDSTLGIVMSYLQLALECSYQYQAYTSRALVRKEVQAKRAEQGIQNNQAEQTAKPKPARNKFVNLIQYSYVGDPPAEGERTKHPHASPRKHTRREHVRHYKSGKTVIIKETVVNPSREPTVYRMGKPGKLGSN